MNTFINPFDAGGFTLADLTAAINVLPPKWSMVSDMGIFKDDPITTTTAIVDYWNGVLNMLPTVPRGGPATVGNRDTRNMRSFIVPHIPHDDVILPADIQSIRGFGSADGADPLVTVMNRKLQRMRDRHAYTLEYMRLNALKGIVKDGSGATVINLFTEFGISQQSYDFLLGTATTDIAAICRNIKRYLARNLLGETMTTPICLVSPTFWDGFIGHTTVKEAYKYFNETTGNPQREDRSTGFVFQGIMFKEYDATFTLSGGTTDEAFTGKSGICIPQGTSEAFVTHYSPANFMETVNTMGVQMYARQVTRLDGRGIDLLTESNPLPVVRRPALCIAVTSSN